MRVKSDKQITSRWPYIVIALLLITFGVAGTLGYREYNSLKKENARLMNPEESAKAEKERVKAQVEKLVDTPKDEEPIIATVTDVDKLKSQEFYANAQNNDKALFYEKSKRAILYRPSTNKIINTSSLEIKNNAAEAAKPATSTPAPAETAEPAPQSGTDTLPVANPYQ